MIQGAKRRKSTLGSESIVLNSNKACRLSGYLTHTLLHTSPEPVSYPLGHTRTNDVPLQSSTRTKQYWVITPPANNPHLDRDAGKKPVRRVSHCEDAAKRVTLPDNCSGSTNASERPKEREQQLRTLREKTRRILETYKQREGRLVEVNRRLRCENLSLKRQIAQMVG